ncbi:MAG: hypothetical protein EXQ70_04875 [Solirubrobacterales bacterium]|nr:hypothetical protein [Solirubrobacterales bacterium]
MFEIELEGQSASIEDLLPGWQSHDRYGLVIDRPLGGIGASLLTQVAITKFFDHRRSNGREAPAVYPEIYAFHVGGRWGDHTIYDFWPAYKEVFVPADADLVLEAINGRAITRLAVPDGPIASADFWWPDEGSALDRIVSAWTYDPDGRVIEGDLTITGLSPQTEENPAWLLDLDAAIASASQSDDPDDRRWADSARGRLEEVPARERERVATSRAGVLEGGMAIETYSRISTHEALRHLAPESGSRESGA